MAPAMAPADWLDFMRETERVTYDEVSLDV